MQYIIVLKHSFAFINYTHSTVIVSQIAVVPRHGSRLPHMFSAQRSLPPVWGAPDGATRAAVSGSLSAKAHIDWMNYSHRIES